MPIVLPSAELREALKFAHDRLANDSDAYADEDLLRQVYDAVTTLEPEHAPVRDLQEAAVDAATKAREAGTAGERLDWAKAARECQAAADELIGVEPDAEYDDSEDMRAVARVLGQVREENGVLKLQRDSLANFVRVEMENFEGANTPTAARVAARFREILEHVIGVQFVDPPAQ